jgi:hypothetical protein
MNDRSVKRGLSGGMNDWGGVIADYTLYKMYGNCLKRERDEIE